jgi:folate-binding protein YgfZ
MPLDPQHGHDDHELAIAARAERTTGGYDEARHAAAVHARGARGLLGVSGGDAVSFLHGILTNDIASLAPGRTRYAAYLTPQGRMISDMRIIRRPDDLLLEVEPSVHEALAARLDRSLFTEDVQIEDRSAGTTLLSVCGPAARDRLAVALDVDDPEALRRLGDDEWLSARIDAHDVLLAGSSRLVVPSVDVLASPRGCASLRMRLLAAGTPALTDEQAEALRIEAGTPVFGIDMTDQTIPLEAGIEGRAISMAKGCYIGQEVIVRILHRGGGRVARRLVGLRVEGDAVPAGGSELTADGRAVGHVTSSVRSPRFGVIALGYVQRDMAEPGVRLALADSGAGVVVQQTPFD